MIPKDKSDPVYEMTLQQIADAYDRPVEEILEVINAHCQKQVYINKVRDLILNDCVFEGTVPLETLNEEGVK